MGLFYTFLVFAMTDAFALLNPNQIYCDSKVPFRIEGDQKSSSLKPGQYRFPIKQVQVLTVLENDKKLAKLFPQAGIDSVIFDKSKFFIKTDQATSWQLYDNKKKNLKISCELVHD